MNLSNKKWLILISTGIMIMLVNLDMTIVNLALAKISTFFNATINQAQWIISSYLLATALSFIIFGRLADHWGRKKIFIFGIFLFTSASLVAGLTQHLFILIVARFVQGLGFAATLGLSIVFIVNAFPEDKKGFATGMAVMITGLAQVAGPTLGGIILQFWNWHGIFLLNVPLGIISFIMTVFVAPNDTVKTDRKLPFTFYNVILFSTGLGMILYSLNQASILNWKIILSLLIIGLVLLTVFIKDCKNKKNTLIDIVLLYNDGFLNVILLRFMFMIMMSSLLFIVPLYLQNILNMTPFVTGLVMLSMTVFVAISSPLTGKLTDKIGFFYPIMFSFICAVASTLLMLSLQAHPSYALLGLSLMFFGLAVGIHTPSSISGALAKVPKEKAGTAIGIFFTLAISGAIVGVALSGTLINLVSHYYLYDTITASSLPANVFNALLKTAAGTVNINSLGLSATQLSEYQPKVYQAFIQAFHSAVAILSILMLIAFGLSVRQKRLAQRISNCI